MHDIITHRQKAWDDGVAPSVIVFFFFYVLRLEELEETNANLENEFENKVAHLEKLLKREEGYKKQLGLPPNATIDHIQDKIDEMVGNVGGVCHRMPP